MGDGNTENNQNYQFMSLRKSTKVFHIPEFSESPALVSLETGEVWVGKRTKKDFNRNISVKERPLRE